MPVLEGGEVFVPGVGVRCSRLSEPIRVRLLLRGRSRATDLERELRTEEMERRERGLLLFRRPQ